MKRTLLTMAVLLTMIFAMGASLDRREYAQFPVARVECTRVSWATGDGHAAKTTTATVNGIIYRIDVIASEVTANPTLNVTFADQNGTVCIAAQNALPDGTANFRNALVNSILVSADFNPVAVAGTITVTVDPSADPGGVAQTLTVDVIFYVR